MAPISTPLPPTPVNSVAVIVGFDLIGDGLIKLPFVRALRTAFPQARITWIAAQGTSVYHSALKEVVTGLIDEVLEKPAWLPTMENPGADAAQAPRYDVVLDTRNRWKEAKRIQGLKPGLFIAPAWRYLFSGKRPSLFRAKPTHVLGRLFEMLELASGVPPTLSGGLHLPDAWTSKARQLLPLGQAYVGFAPGAGADHKIWPLEHYIEVAKLQIKRTRVPVFLLGPKETAWQNKILFAVPSALFPLQMRDVWGEGPQRIEETIAVGQCLAAAVANDSGTGHMLAAADCPLVSLFGPTDYRKLAPRVSRGEVIAGKTMQHIETDAVSRAIENVIRRQA